VLPSFPLLPPLISFSCSASVKGPFVCRPSRRCCLFIPDAHGMGGGLFFFFSVVFGFLWVWCGFFFFVYFFFFFFSPSFFFADGAGLLLTGPNTRGKCPQPDNTCLVFIFTSSNPSERPPIGAVHFFLLSPPCVGLDIASSRLASFFFQAVIARKKLGCVFFFLDVLRGK